MSSRLDRLLARGLRNPLGEADRRCCDAALAMRSRFAAWGILLSVASCAPAAPTERPALPATSAGATAGRPSATPTSTAAQTLCGMPIKASQGARLEPTVGGAEPVVQVAAERGFFEIDNTASKEQRSCAFVVAGPAVTAETVFFGYGSLRAPAGRLEQTAPGRVRVTYPIPGGTHGLISVEPAVTVPADPHRFSHGTLAYELEGAALLRFDGAVPHVRSLGPGGRVVVNNGGSAPAAVEFVVDNVSSRMSEPALTGLPPGALSQEPPLTLRIRGELAAGKSARLTLVPRSLQQPYAFVFGGDIRGNTAVFVRLVRKAIGEHDPLFAVISGDYTDNSLPGELEAYVEAVRDLPVPLYPVLGNHELHTQGLRHYARLFGPKRYAFVVGDVAMVVLDSNDAGPEGFRIGAEQFDWLDQTLERYRSVRHKMVALHAPPQPLHAPSPWAFYPANLDSQDATRLEEIARRHSVAYVLSGHVHSYARGQRQGTVYLTSGGGGAHLSPGVPQPGFELVAAHHVMVLEVRPGRVVEHRVSLSSD